MDTSINYETSYFLYMIVRPLLETPPDVCKITDDLQSKAATCNPATDLTNCVLGNMVVVSLDVYFAIDGCIEGIRHRESELRDVNVNKLDSFVRLVYDSFLRPVYDDE